MAPYRRIAAELRRRIETGVLLDGDQLPTLPALCDEFNVTKGTVTRSLALLRDENLIFYEPGWGYFVGQPEPGL